MGPETEVVQVRRASRWAVGATVIGAAAGAAELVTGIGDVVTFGIGVVTVAGICAGVLALGGAAAAVLVPWMGVLLFAWAGSGGFLLRLSGPLPGVVLLFAAALVLGTMGTPEARTGGGRAAVAGGVAVHAALGVPIVTLGLVLPDDVVLGLLLGGTT